MGSLTAHLLETGDHGRLRFHPSCPVCRQERLFGTLSSEPVVSRRAQAVLAGGVLAFSSAAPGGAVASEPDRQHEGVVAPDQSAGPQLDDPGFEPGGETALPFDTAPAPAVPEDGAGADAAPPLDAEPAVDLDAQPAPLTEGTAPEADAAAPVPPVEVASPAEGSPPVEGVAPVEPMAPDPAVTPGDTLAPDTNVGAAEPPVTGSGDGEASEPEKQSPPKPRTKSETEAPPVRLPASNEVVGDTSGMPSSYVAQVAPAVEPVAVVSASPSPASGGSLTDARFHVVEPGDSLWSIAKRLLGGDASPAKIAREVNRLWSLNEARIATGDPDLLRVGTRLRLR